LPSNLWDKIELVRDGNPNFKPESFLEKQKQTTPEVVAAFGTNAPPSSDFLLHYGKGWDTAPNPVPVLLIHGATKDAADWVDPKENLGKEPLGAYLCGEGFKVFGITFSHDQGDNYYWSQQIANAVERIKKVTGADKVDIVAHSKGALPARMYASDFRKDWMTPYRQDVRNLVLLGAPNLGIDFAFRHPVINYALYPEGSDPKTDAPMVWDSLLYKGMWHGTKKLSIYGDGGDYFPGQRQLLYRWDGKYMVNPLEPDWYTTYRGGHGFVSSSRGIDYSIAESGNFIENLRKQGVHKDVRIFTLVGKHPDVPGIHNEHDGPSDGIVFIDSASYTKDMEKDGAKVFDKRLLPINHMELRFADPAKAWVRDALLNTDKVPRKGIEKEFKAEFDTAKAEFKSRAAEYERAPERAVAGVPAGVAPSMAPSAVPANAGPNMASSGVPAGVAPAMSESCVPAVVTAELPPPAEFHGLSEGFIAGPFRS
jgi:pimeloyl-ACP methyl ester carboxylesterase